MHNQVRPCLGQRSMGGAIAAALLFSTFISCAPPSAPPQPPPPRPVEAYRIVPGDVLELMVWGEEQVSGNVTVRPDGKVSVNLIGDSQAEGLTPEELAAQIEKDLQRFIEAPKVVVRVGQSGRHFYVIGNVAKPGMYGLLPQQTLVQGIALSGGFTEFANRGSIRIMRQAGPQVAPAYDYDDIVSGETPDIMLETNDTIVVP